MTDIIQQLRSIVDTGTEDEVRSFVAEHFSNLPADMQKELGVELFKEALDEEVREREAIVAQKREALALISALEKAEKQLGNAN